MMLGESKQKSYNIALKNVVQTMIKIVIEITNDSEWLSLLEKWRHVRMIALDVRTQCVTARWESTNENTRQNWSIPVLLLSSIEQWAYQAFHLDQ